MPPAPGEGSGPEPDRSSDRHRARPGTPAGAPPAGPDDTADDSHHLRRKGEADAWNAFSLVLSGMLVWGGAGWLVARWVDSRAPIGLGLMLGTGAGLALVWLRYGRAQ